MSDKGKRIFASSGISSSLDTVLATTLGQNYSKNYSSYKKSNSNLISEKSLSNHSSKSSSGSSLTLTNNNNSNGSANPAPGPQFPHHQFYSSQISTSNNWNSAFNIRSNSLCSQKVSPSSVLEDVPARLIVLLRRVLNLLTLIVCASEKHILALLRRGFISRTTNQLRWVQTQTQSNQWPSDERDSATREELASRQSKCAFYRP